MRPSSRDRIMKIAHDLFYEHGFHTVGIDQIVSEAGVTKTTFYNHFESKEELMLDVLRWHDKWWRDQFRALLRHHAGDAPRDQLLAIPDAIEQTISAPGFNGCIFVNVAVQFPLPHDPAHALAAEHKAKMEDLYRELAGYAGASDPVALAAELAMMTEGAYVTRQVTHDPRTADIFRRLVERTIEQHLP